MTLTIVKARGLAQKKEFAAIALKHRLYVSGWSMSGEYVYMRDSMDYGWDNDSHKKYSIALAYEDDVAVGCAIVNDINNLQVFVRKAKRGLGIGRQLVAKVKRAGCYGICGSDGDGKIFVGNGVTFR